MMLENALLQDLDIKQICVEFYHFFPEIPRSKIKALIQLLKKISHYSQAYVRLYFFARSCQRICLSSILNACGNHTSLREFRILRI
jgi:hypothetical protein